MGMFADYALSERLERAEAGANVAFVETRARLAPETGATWIEVAGTYAMFDAPDSPVTQTFGLGMFGEVTGHDLDLLEQFFFERNAAVHHEISPLAHTSVWPLISSRGYAPVEFTSLLFLELAAPPPPPSQGLQVRVAMPAESALWAKTAAAAWLSDHPEMAGALMPVMENVFHVEGVTAFFAEKDGVPIATAALNIRHGVGLLAGGSTVPEARKLGVQRALLAARLRYASAAGCDLAAMGALPGSASQRNAERSGFRIAYTRTKWRREVPAV